MLDASGHDDKDGLDTRSPNLSRVSTALPRVNYVINLD